MNASFGIDHPLVAVTDIETTRNRLIAFGFNMTPVGHHPWGTSNTLAMFNGCLLEIMSVYDESLLDLKPAGGFRFGRHVHDHLLEREGIALTALHSTDCAGDAQRAQDAGWQVSGHLEFGRDVTLPDGRHERTKTSLALMPSNKWPRLSLFLCQQHRPDLIYVPEWLEHRNSVSGICGITVMAAALEQPSLAAHLRPIYGQEMSLEGGIQFATANGLINIQTRDTIIEMFGSMPPALVNETEPCIIAIHFRYSDKTRLLSGLENSRIPFKRQAATFTTMAPALTGNTYFLFIS